MEFKKWVEVFDALPTSAADIKWFDDETDEELPGPTCGRHLTARLPLAGQSYWLRMEESDANSYSISFGTRERGVFMTKGGTPFSVLTAVFGVIGQFLHACPQVRFNFTGHSEARNRVFTRLLAKFFPDYAQDEQGYYAKGRSATRTA